jgi:hypothetical protein
MNSLSRLATGCKSPRLVLGSPGSSPMVLATLQDEVRSRQSRSPVDFKRVSDHKMPGFYHPATVVFFGREQGVTLIRSPC